MPYSNFRNWVNNGYSQFTISSSTALAFSTVVPGGTSMFLLGISNNPVNWRDDGTAPTTAIGMPLASGQEMAYQGQFNKLQVICSTSGSLAVASCAFYT